MLWGLLDVVIAFYAWFGLTGTRGKSLEEIANVNRPTRSKSIDEDEGYGAESQIKAIAHEYRDGRAGSAT